MTLISDDMVQKAFDWLNENSNMAAGAKADRIRAEYGVKKAKAKVFLASAGTVAERESEAICSDEFSNAVEKEAEAVADDEFYRDNRSKCIAIIDAWRTEQSNLRGMSRVG